MSERELCDRIVTFVNTKLLAPDRPPVDAHTPLFEHGVLDSLRVLDLMAFVEAASGRPLPDSAIRLANFRTAETVAATALDRGGGETPARDRIWSRTRSKRTEGGSLPGASMDDTLAQWGRELGAREVDAAPLIAFSILSRAGYLDSFPGRAVGAHCDSDGSDRNAIPPAACLHCYADLADAALGAQPLVLAIQNRCARGDEQVDARHGRLREFTMHEIVVVGSATDVERIRRALMRRVQTWLTRLDLAATIDVATDPFHIPADRGKLALQRLRALKYELRMKVEGQAVAVASFNYHEDYFGRAFGISLPDGSPAHTGCVAFGKERWELALREQQAARATDVARSA